MQWVSKVVALLLVGLVMIYTVNYGRWALRRGLVRGAVGLFLLAALTVLVPGFTLFLRK